MTEEDLVLAGEFPQPTEEEWGREVLKAMNRRRPPGTELTLEQAIKRLTAITVDGLSISPLYTEADGHPIGYPAQMPFTRGSELPDMASPWIVEQLHEDPDAARTNRHVHDDLERGARGVWLRVDDDAIAPADLAKALDGVVPGAADIAVSSIGRQAEAAEALVAFLEASGEADEATGTLGIDPMAAAAVTGKPADLAGLAGWVAKAPGSVRALTVDVTPYDDAGCGDVQQLGYAVATGIAYVRALAEQGVGATEAFDSICFRVAATADQFATICRLRALRRLWARVGEVLDVAEADRGAVQQAVTSRRILTRDDPWVNLLRVTISSFASAVGGAETVTTLPHDEAYGLPTPFSRRLARNIQLLAEEETRAAAVKDPGGGSWFIESLTDQMCDKAWALVQEIEAAGGMAKALADGLVASQIAEVANARAKLIATRKLPITGVSMFPKPDETPLTDVVPRPARPTYGGLPVRRDAAPFEALRTRSRAYAARHGGEPPAALLACLGDQREFGGRQMFTSNLLWVAGLATPELQGPTAAELAAEASAKKCAVVVLASSAKVYAEEAIAAAKALKDAGVACVCLAGRKTETGSDEADKLIDVEIYDGMDVVAFLSDTLDRLGVDK